MKSFSPSLLWLSLALLSLGCQSRPPKEGGPEAVPVADAAGKKAGMVPLFPPKSASPIAEAPPPTADSPPKKADEPPLKGADLPEVQRLIANLGDKDWLVRRDAAEALGNLGDKQAVDPLIARLKDADNGVRLNAAEALGKLGDKRAVEPLIGCLQGKGADRSFAAEVLGKLGDPRAVPALIACLKDGEADRSFAAAALGNLGDKQAVEPLIACLQDKEPRVRREAAAALGKLGDKTAAAPLIATLPDWPIKDAVGTALKQLDGKPSNDKERFYCHIAACDDKGLLKDWKQTRQWILEDAGSHDFKKLQNAVYVAIALGKEELVDDLVKILDSSEDAPVVELYLNCGHQGLRSAAEKWAGRHGLQATQGVGHTGPAWGRW